MRRLGQKRVFSGALFAITAATAPVIGQVFVVTNNTNSPTQSGSLPYEVGLANAYNGPATVEISEAFSATTSSGPTLQNPNGNTITGDDSDLVGNTTVSAGTFTLGDGTDSIYLSGTAGTAISGVATAGAAGLTFNNNTTSGVLANASITGGVGGSGSGVGGGGGAGVSLTVGGTLGNAGSITGGAGSFGTSGGTGGFGVSFAQTGTLTNNGSITGGAGGSGESNTGVGGNGGAGVGFTAGGMFTNNSGGAITGGAGGADGSSATVLSVGGAGVSFTGTSGSMTNAGSITGGNAVSSNTSTGNTGGAGVSFTAGGSITNTGAIIGGNGASGSFYGGNGGAGVSFTDGGTLTNSGTITPGAGAFSPVASGANGAGVQFSNVAGTLLNNTGGSITGGVSMGNFANNVTLQIGSTITGGLNIGSSTASTLTLTDNGSGGTQNYSAAADTTTFAGSLIKSGSGTWVMNQPMNYAGSTTIDSGTLSVGTLAVGGASSEIGASTNASGNLYLNGGTLLYTGASVNTDRGFTVDGANGGTLNVSSSSAALQFTGAVVGGILTKTGAGTLTLGGTADNSGLGVTLDAGTLILAKTSSSSPDVHAIGGAGLTINGGTAQLGGTGGNQFYIGAPLNLNSGTFDLHGESEIIGTLSGTTAGNITNNAGTSATLTVNGGGIYAGTITNGSGAVSLVDSGTSTLTLTATNTFTGGTTVNAGTLVLGDGVHRATLGTTGSTYAITANNDTTVNILNNATVSGANAISFTDGGTLNNSGSITANTGVSFAGNGAINNYGSISGGVSFTGGGTLTNYGSVSNGIKATNAAVTIVNESGASNAGAITLDNYANNVTLQIGSSSSGGLNMGTSTSATLTLTDNGSGGTGTLSKAAGSTTLYGTLLKTGLGTWIVDESIGSNATAIISTGTLQLGDGLSNNGSVASNITDSSALIFANPNTQTYSGVISGSGSVTKTGAGQLTLTAAQTYTGGTTLNAGTLTLASGSSPAVSLINGVQFSGAATLIDGGSIPGGVYSNNYAATVTLQSGGVISNGVNLGTSNGSSLTLQNGSSVAGGVILGANSAGSVTLQNGSSVTVGINLGVNSAANVTLQSDSSVTGGVTLGANSAGNVTIQNGSSVSGGVTLGTSSTTNVTVQIGGTITGGLNMGANTGATLTLSDNGSGGSENYSSAVDSTTFAGELVKSGSGTWVINQSLPSTTSTTINAGTLQIGAGGPATISIGTANITDNGALAFDNPGNQTVTATISGTGALIQNGPGTLTLNGPNATFTGGAIVNQGTLVFAGTSTPFTLAGAPGSTPGAPTSGIVALTINDNSSTNVLSNETINGGAGTVGQNNSGAGGSTAVVLSAGGQLTNYGSINGGAGGPGGNNNFEELSGGSGGTGVNFTAGGSLNNSGVINGGAGNYANYHGGDGGAGVSFTGLANLTNNLTGCINGGGGAPTGNEYGGGGGAGVTSQTAGATFNNAGAITAGSGSSSGYVGGVGGTGVNLATGSNLTNTGTISGGMGGGGNGVGGAGGNAVSFAGSGTLTNSGSIIAGNGGNGTYNGGNGAAGVNFTDGGECINSGTITAGSGGQGQYTFGTNATSINFTGAPATLINQYGGSIPNGVSMDNFANTVTLQIGSSIGGGLNVGNSPLSTLTLTDNGSGGTQNYSAAVQSTGFSGSLFKTGSGTWVIDQPMNYSGTTTVNAGTLVANDSALVGSSPNQVLTNEALPANSAVSIGNGTLRLGASTGLTTLSSIAITGTGTFDVSNNHAIINYGSGPDPIASIAALLKAGYNAGAWNGAGGITTSAPLVVGGLTYGLGYADGDDAQRLATGLASGTIEIKYTLLGDADLNGIVNGIDFGILAANFNKGITGWDEGDFDYNNIVNGLDFGDLAANFNKGASGTSVGLPAYADPAIVAFAQANGLLADLTSVPEPASIALISLGACGLLSRRRRNSL